MVVTHVGNSTSLEIMEFMGAFMRNTFIFSPVACVLHWHRLPSIPSKIDGANESWTDKQYIEKQAGNHSKFRLLFIYIDLFVG